MPGERALKAVRATLGLLGEIAEELIGLIWACIPAILLMLWLYCLSEVLK